MRWKKKLMVETTVANDGILWLNEKHIEEGLYQKIWWTKKQLNTIFIDKKLVVKVIMDCKKTAAHKFRTRLGFR